MPTYQYKAIDAAGKKVQDICNAHTRDEVLKMIKENRGYPIEIKEIVEAKDVGSLSLFRFSPVKLKDIAVFCRQFYTMLHAGVPIISCLDILRLQTENKRFKKIIGEIFEDVQKGLTFSEALKNHPGVFPELLIHMVETGEVTGNLDQIMDRMAIYYEKENKLHNKIKSAMVYPTILAIVSVLIVIFLLTFVMPVFVSMFEKSGTELPWITQILLAVSEGIRSYWYLILALLVVFAHIFKRYSKTDQYRLMADRLKLKIPILKSNTQKVITSRFMRTLSILLFSGVPLMQSLEIVARVVGNKVVELRLLQVREEVRKGMDLATPIKNIKIFPAMVDSMIRVGEESGFLDEILDKTANFYDEEVEVSMQKLMTILEPLMIVMMSFIIGFIVIAMVLPMFDMMKAMPL